MSDLRIDPVTNDLLVENEDVVLLSDSDADLEKRRELIMQMCRQALKLFLGEWFLDTAAGVPYYQEVLKKNPNPQVLDAVFKQTIITVPGIEELLSFAMDFEGVTRTLKVEFEARSTAGVITFAEPVEV